MAILDTDANEIVIRVVYDGPPMAGKTTSMRALAASLAQSTVTPEEDADGRTLWFDWMEYVGGRFEGSRIRCQIVSVPGQVELAARRRALLASADVVVFVADSSPPRWDVSIEYLQQLRTLVAAPSGHPDVGVVFQANKRDAPDAIAMPALRTRLGDARWSVGVVESVASDGRGIREGFVYAVRLALDRVRELITLQALPSGTRELTSPEQLLAQLKGEVRSAEDPAPPRVESAPDSVAAQLLDSVISAEEAAAAIQVIRSDESAVEETKDVEVEAPRAPVDDAKPIARPVIDTKPIVEPGKLDLPPAMSTPVSDAAPQLPDASVPSGAIWPPVEGRAILYEIAQLGLTTRRLGNGDWTAGLGSGFRIVSARDAVFDSLDAGRAALVQWARLHSACAGAISQHRCIVLAASGEGQWRLWQVVRVDTALREVVESAIREPTPEQVVTRLCQVAQLLIDLHERLAELPCDLPCNLDTVGQSDATSTYIGLMPYVGAPGPARSGTPAMLVAALGPMVDLDLADQRDELGAALERIPHTFMHAETVVASLQSLFTAW